jgi:tripartite-type tricarboxylate transporter receptor subunit TctC
MKFVDAWRALARSIALLLVASTVAGAADYPSKPVRIIVPFAAGGTADIVARIVALKMGENTGTTFVVENRTGAGGRIGYEAGAKSPGDGYTFVATDATYTMLPGLYGKLAWDQANDLLPVTISAQAPFAVIVGPNAKTRTLPELLAYAKANPGKITYGSAGVGSVNHIVTELFKRDAGIDITHVPYKGMGDAMIGMLTGTIDLLITALPTAIPQIKNGKIFALAVTSAKRSSALPDVPTVAERGVPDFVVGNWFGLTAPKGTPKEAIAYIHGEVVKAIASPDLKERLAAQGAEPSGITPQEMGKLLVVDTKQWTGVIRGAGIKAE